MKTIVCLLVFCLVTTAVCASTFEATITPPRQVQTGKFLQEFDITFWQTAPFAVFWSYFIERELASIMYPGTAANWGAILIFATALSAGNAYYRANTVVNK